MDEGERAGGWYHGDLASVGDEVEMAIGGDRRGAVLARAAAETFGVDDFAIGRIDGSEETSIAHHVQSVFVKEGRGNFWNVAMHFPRGVGVCDVAPPAGPNGH